MNTKLTLGEKLKDLRIGKDLKLADVEAATGISTSTLQRIEADADIRVGYQDIETLTRFYDVSADYLFGLTDLDQYRNIEIDKLRLSDEAIPQGATANEHHERYVQIRGTDHQGNSM